METITTGDIIINYGSDDYTYREILNNINNAQDIFISTYNFSSDFNNSHLLNTLKHLDANITIVTNIPRRFPHYFFNSEHYRRNHSDRDFICQRDRVRNHINDYLNNLDPKSFQGNVKVYFNYRNHSKMYILDENYAYIGSGNYSDESSSSYEIGTILTNQCLIRRLKDSVVRNLCEDSIRIAGRELDELNDARDILCRSQTYLQNSIAAIKDWNNILDSLNNGTFEPDGVSIFSYKEEMINYTKTLINVVSNFKHNIEDYIDLLKKYDIDIQECVDEIEIVKNNIYDICSERELNLLSDYNRETYEGNYLSKHLPDAVESDEIDAVSKAAGEYADEKLDEIFEKIHDNVLDGLDDLIESLNPCIDNLSNLNTTEELVDELLRNMNEADNT